MSHKILAQKTVAGFTITAVLGDLTEIPVDAIVNAANSRLVHGGGLAAAIVRVGGDVIQEESLRAAPVPVGSAAATSAGDLPCRWVIHTVGPRWGEGNEEAKLRSAVRAALDTAIVLDTLSVAMPAISTGIFGYPKRDGTRHILDEVVRWTRTHPESTLREIFLAAFDEETANLFSDALDNQFGH